MYIFYINKKYVWTKLQILELLRVTHFNSAVSMKSSSPFYHVIHTTNQVRCANTPVQGVTIYTTDTIVEKGRGINLCRAKSTVLCNTYVLD